MNVVLQPEMRPEGGWGQPNIKGGLRTELRDGLSRRPPGTARGERGNVCSLLIAYHLQILSIDTCYVHKHSVDHTDQGLTYRSNRVNTKASETFSTFVH